MSTDAAASPRTDELPMAFSGWEFARGAGLAWAWFMGLSIIALIPAAGPLVLFVPVYALPGSLVALVVGSPLAFLLGRMLRRRTSVPVHLLAFAGLGAAIGAAMSWLLFGVWSFGWGGPGDLYPSVAITIASAVAVMLGWWGTARRALRDDRAATDADGVIPAPSSG